MNLVGFNTLTASRPNRTGGGVALLIHQSVYFDCMKKFSDDYISLLSVKIKILNTINIINVCYSPPNRNTEFLEVLNLHLSNSAYNSIFVGDVNINLLNTNNIFDTYMTILNCNGYHICDSSTPTHDSGSLLDHVIVNNINQNKAEY